MLRACLLLLALLQDPSAPKIELKVRPVEGDVLEVSDSWTHTFRGTLGEERMYLSTRGGRRLVVEMARVEGGKLTGKNVQVNDAYVEQQDVATGKYIRKDDAIHGRKATITLKNGREERTGLEGVSEPEQKTLTLEDPLTRLFPAAAVRVGESWELAGDDLKKFFPAGDFTEGRIVVTLRDVKEIDGKKCALLATNYDVSGKSADGVTRELRLLGTLTVWVDRGYVLAMTQTGRLKTSGADPKTNQPNGEAAVTGELKTVPVEKKK